MTTLFEDFGPEEYAALWGCDPVYDRPPREAGDGYLFYNFAVERDDPDFLRKFIPAIERTIECVEVEGTSEEDMGDLEDLLDYVKELLVEVEVDIFS
jgi:hypothetical protein